MTDYTDPERSIGRRPIAAGSARTALLRRDYDAPIDDVWDACTDRERLSRWFLPISGDLRLGGNFSLEGNASGEVLRCERPRLLLVTWKYADHPIDELELRLFPSADGGTTVEIEHATVSDRTEWEGRSYDSIFGVATGWEPAMYALDRHLAGTLSDDITDAWRNGQLPVDVKDLIARSEDAWAAIVEASGSPAVQG
jgi:uncharacterized protein YndB with AHSA1/START domain